MLAKCFVMRPDSYKLSLWLCLRQIISLRGVMEGFLLTAALISQTHRTEQEIIRLVGIIFSYFHT